MRLKITALPVAVLVSLALPPAALAHPHHRHHAIRHHHTIRHTRPAPARPRASIEYVDPAANPAAAAPVSVPTLPSSSFPTYGNVGSNGVGDCQFAAAADWEIIQLGRIPPEAEVIGDFNAASSRGEEAWDYWPRYGIDGVYAKVETSWPNTDANLLSLLAIHHAVLAQITVSSEYHAVVVAGSNATGPLLVTWGETLQWTWPEWDARKRWIAIVWPTRQV